jgi:tRNA A-37 threonylcarbamoyl transferase component Bud32
MDWELFYKSFRKPGFIPGFEIQNRLGGGAFGDVYKARKVSIGKHYAIKFLKIDDQAQRGAIERELEQVRHFASIDHPNLVTIEDMGVALDVPYLVMGYAGEDTLARRMRRERIGRDLGLTFFVQICRGVGTLHARRLAHFDLKPSNVFLKGEVARVGDYGLAKLMIDGRQTLSFGRGTPHYMAPEMLKNRADQRADLYSLGVILYELTAGKLPFEPVDGIGVVMREEDVAPEFPEDFPLELRRVVARCLRIDPADRFASVDELLAVLGQSSVLGEPVRTEPARTDLPAGAARERSKAPSGELRATATDLARGAVEVARGVWEGLREGSTSAKEPRPGRRTVPGTPGDTVGHEGQPTWESEPAGEPKLVSIETLADVRGAQREPIFAVAGTAAAAAAGLPLPPRPSRTAGGAASGAARAGTIPVPPRAEGGMLRSTMATFQLGLEVLLSLLTGPVKRTLGTVGRAGDRFVRRGRGILGALLRLVLFLVGMVLLGALLMFVLVTWFPWG